MNAGRLAWIGLVLMFLTVFCLGVALTAHIAGNAVRTASVLSDAYDDARNAVGAEESRERKYRLEPGVEVRALYDEAAVRP